MNAKIFTSIIVAGFLAMVIYYNYFNQTLHKQEHALTSRTGIPDSGIRISSSTESPRMVAARDASTANSAAGDEKTGKSREDTRKKMKTSKPLRNEKSYHVKSTNNNLGIPPLNTLSSTFKKLWNPFSNDGRLNDQSVELLGIDGKESSAIQNALDQFHEKYKDHLSTTGRLIKETDTTATFRIDPYGVTAHAANEDFLRSIQGQVSAATYDLMVEGLPMFGSWFGCGLAWNNDSLAYDSYYQEITIAKLPNSDRFQLEVTSKYLDGKKIGTTTFRTLEKQAVINYCSQMIINNTSSILE